MAVHTAVDVLSALLESYGSGPGEVRTVDASASGTASLSAEVVLAVPLAAASRDGGIDAELAPDGRIRVELEQPDLSAPPSVPAGVSVAAADVTTGADGDLLVTVTVDIDTEPASPAGAASDSGESTTDGRVGATATAEPSSAPAADGAATAAEDVATDGTERGDRLAAVRTPSVPPYEDVPYLRLLYETCDTFGEMRDRIDMDVSTETVRRYMIDAGVHEPASYETATDGSLEGGEPPVAPDSGAGTEGGAPLGDDQLVTDGLGLPEDLSIDAVLDAVVESATVYEVECRLGLGQHRTRELLRELDLLDLVLHRVTENPGECTYEEAAMRIRQTASGRA